MTAPYRLPDFHVPHPARAHVHRVALATPTNPVERGLLDLWNRTPAAARSSFRRAVLDMADGWRW